MWECMLFETSAALPLDVYCEQLVCTFILDKAPRGPVFSFSLDLTKIPHASLLWFLRSVGVHIVLSGALSLHTQILKLVSMIRMEVLGRFKPLLLCVLPTPPEPLHRKHQRFPIAAADKKTFDNRVFSTY